MKVFLSYHSSDKKFVDLLEESLYRFGMEPIVVENNIQAGSNITHKVIDALEQFDIFMPILTRNSVNSEWVNQEIGFAVARTNSYPSQNSVVFPGQQSGYVIPIIQDGLGSRIKGFLVNIEGIKYDPRNPDNTIINIIIQLSNLPNAQVFYGGNNQYDQRCPNCKDLVQITRPSIEEIIETIQREENLLMVCPHCNELLIINPKTLALIQSRHLSEEEFEQLRNQFNISYQRRI